MIQGIFQSIENTIRFCSVEELTQEDCIRIYDEYSLCVNSLEILGYNLSREELRKKNISLRKLRNARTVKAKKKALHTLSCTIKSYQTKLATTLQCQNL